MHNHVIWGEVERSADAFNTSSSNGTKDTKSSSTSSNAEEAPSVPSASSARRVGPMSRRKLPKEVQQYLDSVTFQDSSSGDSNHGWAEGMHGRSGRSRSRVAPLELAPPPPVDRRRLPNWGSASGAEASSSSAARPPWELTERGAETSEEEDEEEEEEEEANEDDGPAITTEELRTLSKEQRLTIIALMMESGQELTLGEEALGDFWSLGSALHNKGKCRPCHYVHTDRGCNKGKECDFCHLPHARRSRPRPCKTKRLQCKRFIAFLEEANSRNPEQFIEAVQKLSARSAYLRGILRQWLKKGVGPTGAPPESGKPGSSSSSAPAASQPSGAGSVSQVTGTSLPQPTSASIQLRRHGLVSL